MLRVDGADLGSLIPPPDQMPLLDPDRLDLGSLRLEDAPLSPS
jgi:hypothetical protein